MPEISPRERTAMVNRIGTKPRGMVSLTWPEGVCLSCGNIVNADTGEGHNAAADKRTHQRQRSIFHPVHVEQEAAADTGLRERLTMLLEVPFVPGAGADGYRMGIRDAIYWLDQAAIAADHVHDPNSGPGSDQCGECGQP